MKYLKKMSVFKKKVKEIEWITRGIKKQGKITKKNVRKKERRKDYIYIYI